MPKNIKLLILCITLTMIAGQIQASDSPTAASSPAFTNGTVVETMNAAGYTYLLIENNGQKRWAAIPASQVSVGDEVEIAAGANMPNFTSKTLGRTFDTIIFSQGIVKR